MKNFQGIDFIWTQTYWQIFKSALFQVLPVNSFIYSIPCQFKEQYIITYFSKESKDCKGSRFV